MTSEQFVYWLQGFVEMNPNAMLTHTQWLTLKDHLATVFKKETPDRFATPAPQEAPFLGSPPAPADRVLTEGWPHPQKPSEQWTPPKPFIRPAWMLPDVQWPPGTVIC